MNLRVIRLRPVDRAPEGIRERRWQRLGHLLLPLTCPVARPAVESRTQVDPLELEFGLPQRHAGDLELGQLVLGTVGRCGQRFEARVDAIDPRVDPATRAVRLQAAVPNLDGKLLPGMAVRVRRVVVAISDAVVIPQEAIIRQGSKHRVCSSRRYSRWW